jgi:hypothetical protein
MKEPKGIKECLAFYDRIVRKIGHKASIEGFVLKHGREWKPTPKLQREFRVHRGNIKECFRNASMAALSDRCLTYVEGFALSVIPVLHAWCVTARGEVVELTWEEAGSEYYGIPFKKEFLRSELLKSRNYGLIDQWKTGWPLLRGKYPKEEWLKT